ncbi:MAG: hypothetical protein HZB65_04745 [Candidatus Aenigmarchaeota archaeon]|nr:hypothetical protein [Candidatus Aenigmarchaeota archaeon]
MAISWTGIFTMFLRLIAYALVIVIFIELVFSFSVIVNSHEMDNVVLELSENMMSSDYNVDGNPLAVSRAMFDYNALKGLDSKKYIEPVRNCEYGAHYTFIDLENNEEIAAFGYGIQAMGTGMRYDVRESISEDMKKDFFIGIKKGNDIIPAKMIIRLYYSRLAQISCAVEKAWYENGVHELSSKPGTAFNDVVERGDGIIGFGIENRWIGPDIRFVEYFAPETVVYAAQKNSRDIILVAVSIKKDRYDFNHVCIDWREPGAEAWRPDKNDIANGNRIICIKTVVQ